MIIVGAAALMLLVGAGVAYASGSGGDSSGQATEATHRARVQALQSGMAAPIRSRNAASKQRSLHHRVASGCDS
jgi:hypothetical protein